MFPASKALTIISLNISHFLLLTINMKLVSFLMNLPSTTSSSFTVELKNGNSIYGQILSCTPSMNISMKNIKLLQPHQEPQLLNFMNIRGNQIRQIILPEDLNIDNVLSKCVRKPASSSKVSKPAVRGSSRGRGGSRGGRGRGRGNFGRR